MSLSGFRFRLCIASKKQGRFAFEQPELKVPISDSLTLDLAARNGQSLNSATNYHFDGGGFTSEQAARDAAEALKTRLRFLNAIFNLGLNIPTENEAIGNLSEELKSAIKADTGLTALDSVWGINIYPDDDAHIEYVFGGDVQVKPSDPSYIFEALKSLWALDISLDSASETALHILGLATQETSDKAAFLTSYLALEQLIEKKPRSEAAREQIRKFQQELTEMADANPEALVASELQSLMGALAALNEESFSSALARFAKNIASPKLIKGLTPRKFFSECIGARNKIAHNAEPKTKIALGELSNALRDIVLQIIWQRNNLPPISIDPPQSAVSIPEGGIQFRVL